MMKHTLLMILLLVLSLICTSCTQTRGRSHRTGGVLKNSVRNVEDVQADRTKRYLNEDAIERAKEEAEDAGEEEEQQNSSGGGY